MLINGKQIQSIDVSKITNIKDVAKTGSYNDLIDVPNEFRPLINEDNLVTVDKHGFMSKEDKKKLNDLIVNYTAGHGIHITEDNVIEYYEGEELNRSGAYSHAEGSGTTASAQCCHAEGSGTTASGDYSHAEGNGTTASGNCSHAEGSGTTAAGGYSHAEGGFGKAMGNFAHVEGEHNKALGRTTHTEGYSTTAKADYAHAEGFATNASGYSSHAEGHSSGTGENAPSSHTEGSYCYAEGHSAHAQGSRCYARGNYSHSGGYGNEANIHYQTTIGSYNVPEEKSEDNQIKPDNSLLIIGNGVYVSETDSEDRSNAFRVDWEGKVYGKGAYNTQGADYAEYFEWSDGNPDNEDRVGYFVTFDKGNKIRKANSGDNYILGVISANPSVIGDNYDEHWKGKYKSDDFNRIEYKIKDVIHESIDPKQEAKVIKHYIPVISSEYQDVKKYIPRRDRKEWSPVGMLGKLIVRDDGSCIASGYCKVGENGIATISNEYDRNTYYVMDRISEDKVVILFK